jgi:hypothetical protein
MILYGAYDIELNRVPARNFIQGESGPLIQYCKVFHLFLIPFFPFKKYWALKRGMEKLEVLPPIHAKLNKEAGKSTPWYAFSWFFLAPVLIALALGYSEYDNWNNKRRSRNHIISYVENTKEKINKASPGELIRISISKNQNGYSNTYTTVMVEANAKDSLLVRVPLGSNLKKPGSNTPASYFLEPETQVGFVWVAKKDFHRALDYKLPDSELAAPPKIQGLYPGYYLSISNYDKPHGFNVEDLRKPQPPLSRFHP